MLETTKKYPYYRSDDESLKTKKALVTFNYEQLIEIANIFYFINTHLDKIPRIFGGLRFVERTRAIHKAIHDAAVNCTLSLEAHKQIEDEGKPAV